MTYRIEDKEIRGISLKTVRWIVFSTITICSTVGGSYYGIQKRFDSFNSHSMLQDLQIKTMQIQVDKLQTEIEILQSKVQDNIVDNERIKAKLNIDN